MNYSLHFFFLHVFYKCHILICWLYNVPTQESIHQAADAPHGPEENLRELLETGVQDHFVRDAAGVEKLLLELGGCAHDGRVAQIHGVTVHKGGGDEMLT